jgi:hypothetical protein
MTRQWALLWLWMATALAPLAIVLFAILMWR